MSVGIASELWRNVSVWRSANSPLKDIGPSFPTIGRTGDMPRKVETISGPLFPRYLVTILDLKRDRWRSINGTLAHGQPLAPVDFDRASSY